jgi:hypothetical protein
MIDVGIRFSRTFEGKVRDFDVAVVVILYCFPTTQVSISSRYGISITLKLLGTTLQHFGCTSLSHLLKQSLAKQLVVTK